MLVSSSSALKPMRRLDGTGSGSNSWLISLNDGRDLLTLLLLLAPNVLDRSVKVFVGRKQLAELHERSYK